MNGKTILAILAGIVVAYGVMFGISSLTYRIYPLDVLAIRAANGNLEEIKAIFLNRPTGFFLLIATAHGIGALAGLFISRLIRKKGTLNLFVILGVLLLLNTINFLTFPHPQWFIFTDIATTLGISIGYIGFVAGRERKKT